MDLTSKYETMGKFIYGSVRVHGQLAGLLGVEPAPDADLKAELRALADQVATKAREAALAPGTALAYATLSDHLAHMASLHEGLPQSIDNVTPQRLQEYASAADVASQLIASCRA